MSTVYLLEDADLLPFVGAPLATEANQLWVDLCEGLETVIYGADVPSVVLPHDHAERRGKPLWESFWACSFGPQAAEGGSATSWISGLPLYPSTGVDFADQPKCLGWWPFRVPAGVKTFFLEFLLWKNGPNNKTIELKARIRQPNEIGYLSDEGNGPSASILVTHTPAVDRVTRHQFSFTDLSSLGDLGIDKDDLVLELWIVGGPNTGTLYRLLAGMAFAGSYGLGASVPTEGAFPRAQVNPTEIQANQFLLSDTSQRAHLRHNQILVESLGTAPGLLSSLQFENLDDAYQTTIEAPHGHRGRRFIDPVSGLARYDGAVTKRILWQITPIVDLGDDGSAMGNAPSRGHKLHSGGTLATQAEFSGRLHMPRGQKSIHLSFGVLSGHSLALCRLFLYAALYDIDGTLIDIVLKAGNTASAGTKSGAFTIVEVQPINAEPWQNNELRNGQGVGLWTNDAARLPAPSFLLEAARTPRHSQRVSIAFSLAKVDYPYLLKLKWALETGARESGVYATGARLAYGSAWVPGGY